MAKNEKEIYEPMTRQSLNTVKKALYALLTDETKTTNIRAANAVNYLLSHDLDEELAEIFNLCTDLELPIGINQYDEHTYKKAWETLLSLCK